MTVYYNEIDPYAAQWLRNLMAAGHIAEGEVDERSITEVQHEDLSGFDQCHFFAGIGVWSHALRRAGWPDDRPVWTGSCPCQPFSAAGQQRGFDDERHLWPVWYRLIDQCRPPVVLGEQVASALDWLDLVSADMEASDYAFGASDLCAAGFGGAHIRQRLYFVGVEGLDHTAGARRFGSVRGAESDTRHEARLRVSGAGKPVGRLADAEIVRRREGIADTRRMQCGNRAQGATGRPAIDGGLDDAGRPNPTNGLWRDAGGVELASRERRQRGQAPASRHDYDWSASEWAESQHGFSKPDAHRVFEYRTHAPLLGRDAADWLFCRDGKWRPVEPGTFPLAHEAPARLGRLRAYGNGLDAETATQFIAAVMDCAP